MTFAGLKAELLLVHGLGVELREGVGGAAESGVKGSIDLVKTCGIGFSLLRHWNSGSVELRADYIIRVGLGLVWEVYNGVVC